MTEITIYKIQNGINGKIYVGQTNDFDRRRYEHTYSSSQCTALKGAMEKYGSQNFKFGSLEICSLNDADDREFYWIKKLNSLAPCGYNLVEGGTVGRNISEEAREHMSEANKGENNPMFGRIGKDSPWYGRKHTIESKNKMSAVQKGRPSPRQGKHISDEHKQNIAQARKGTKHSEETRRKMSLAQKRRRAMENTNVR